MTQKRLLLLVVTIYRKMFYGQSKEVTLHVRLLITGSDLHDDQKLVRVEILSLHASLVTNA